MVVGPPPDVPPLTPVTAECVVEAAAAQSVPLAAIVALMAVEGGQVGRVSINRNLTYDIGPMQINSAALRRLAVFDISEAALLNSGCVNVLVGAWMLRVALVEAKGDIWQAIGRYHSQTPALSLRYQRRVYHALNRGVRLRDALERANVHVHRDMRR